MLPQQFKYPNSDNDNLSQNSLSITSDYVDPSYRQWFRRQGRQLIMGRGRGMSSSSYQESQNRKESQFPGPFSSRADKHILTYRSMLLQRAKLKATSRTSALLAGFAMVALVELDLDLGDQRVPKALLVFYAVCTTLLVSVHLMALMMSTCILPHMDVVANVHSLKTPVESPHERLRFYIELSWFFSTSLGLFLFLVEIVVVFWIKVIGRASFAGWVVTGILLPTFVVFIIFSVQFYRKLSAHHLDVTSENLRGLEQTISEMEETGDGIALFPTGPLYNIDPATLTPEQQGRLQLAELARLTVINDTSSRASRASSRLPSASEGEQDFAGHGSDVTPPPDYTTKP